MKTVDEDSSKNKAAWSACAHIGGKDLSLWMSMYPSGFQPYRNSHFNIDEWTGAGYTEAFASDYLASEADSYNHPNAAIEPRIPGIFQYYSIAEDELSKIYAGQYDAQTGADILLQLGIKLQTKLVENQIKLYKALYVINFYTSDYLLVASFSLYYFCIMSEIKQMERDPLYVVSPSYISPKTKRFGKILVWSSFFLMSIIGIIQILYNLEKINFGFNNWRPLLYSYILWAIAIGYSRVLIYGERGKRNLFIFPAVMFIISIVIFPMLFGLYISFTDWNLSSLDGRKFNGLDNFYQMMSDPYYWNSLKNMIYYILAVLVEFAIAFLLAFY